MTNNTKGLRDERKNRLSLSNSLNPQLSKKRFILVDLVHLNAEKVKKNHTSFLIEVRFVKRLLPTHT